MLASFRTSLAAPGVGVILLVTVLLTYQYGGLGFSDELPVATHSPLGLPSLANTDVLADHGTTVATSSSVPADILETGKPVSTQSGLCTPQLRQQFLSKHARVVAAAKPGQDAWSGPAPVCGVYKLYEQTGVLFTITDAPPHPVPTMQRTSFRIRPCGDKKTCPSVYFAVRFVSARAVVSGLVTFDATDCVYDVSFTLFDPGEYLAEVRVVWLHPSGPEQVPHAHPVTLRKTHSKYGKKPHQKYVFNAACENMTHVAGSPFAITSVGKDILSIPTPLCVGTGKAVGRWVRWVHGTPCRSPICAGDSSFLNDAKPFNKDLVWVPIECHYHVWPAKGGPAAACVKRRGLLMMMGDSTTREYAQNVRMFGLFEASLRKLKIRPSVV